MIKLSALAKLYHDYLHIFFFYFIQLQKMYSKITWTQKKDALFVFKKNNFIQIMIGISKKRLDKKYSDLLFFPLCSLQQSYAPPPPPMAPPSPGNTTGGGGGGGGGHGGGLVEQLSKTNLYIRGLPPATTDQDLIKLCQPWVLFFPPFMWTWSDISLRCILQCCWAPFILRLAQLSLWGNLFCESPITAYSEYQQFALDLSCPSHVGEEKTKPSWPYPIRSHSALGSSTRTQILHMDLTHKALFNQKYPELLVPGGKLLGHKMFHRPMIVCSSSAAWVLGLSCKSASFLDADAHRGPVKCLLTLCCSVVWLF